MYAIKRFDRIDEATAEDIVFPERYEGFEEAYEEACALADNECDEWTDRTDATHFYPGEREEDGAVDVLFYYDTTPEEISVISIYAVVEVGE